MQNIVEVIEKCSNGLNTVDTSAKIEQVLDCMKNLLLYKNRKYGDSILNGKKIFFSGTSMDRITLHLDEKMSRIMNNPDPEIRKNDIMDLVGYLTFLLIALETTKEDFEKEMD